MPVLGGDGTKRCRKMKQRQRAYLNLHKRSVTRRNGVTTSAGGEATSERKREETTLIGLVQILLGRKIKKIYAFDSGTINEW
jgi:hypothetical protein